MRRWSRLFSPWRFDGRVVARRLRAVAIVVALLAVGWLGLGVGPASYWVDVTRFVQPRDAFDVLDRHGAVLRHARVDGFDRRWVELRRISPHLVNAFIAAEDARFRSHDGADGVATLRALGTALRLRGTRSGASTMTQQLVKLVYGRPLGPLSKLVEVGRARALERILSKDEIVEQYLNRVPFGDRIQGVERASEEYFGHSAEELTVAEAALLAGIPRAPSATEPRRHLERARARASFVLGRMQALGFIDEPTRRQAESELPAIRAVRPRPDEAPRFVDAVMALERAGRVERNGGTLRTSIDVELERHVDQELEATVARFQSRGVTNAAGVVVANATGEILAYSGAARRNAAGGSLDLLARRRQPGSTLKPFVYELFFERGGTAATVLDDIALPRTGALGATFEAKDYDGRERGPVRARVALSASLNLAALDVAARVGQDALVDRLRKLGFRGVLDANRYGGAAVLGGLDVAPVDVATAYVALARGGTEIPLALVPGPPRAGARVMTSGAAAVTRDVLLDAHARADAFGADLVALGGGARFALKTGTSSGFRDAWAAVFDDDLTVVVWLGDPAGHPLGGVSGFEAAAPAAARILGAARARAAIDLAAPANATRQPALVEVSVCAATGLRPGAHCTHVVEERFAPDTIPRETCDAHDEHGDVVLAPRYAEWIARTHPSGIAQSFTAPASGDAPVVHEPRDGSRWLVDPSREPPRISLRAWVGRAEARDVVWRIDDAPVGAASWELVPGEHVIVAEWNGKRSPPARVRVDTPSPRARAQR